jgi:hypothetical protein
MITTDTGRPNATWSTTITIAADALLRIANRPKDHNLSRTSKGAT